MILTFSTDVPIEETMVFDAQCFHPNLQLDIDEKLEIFRDAYKAFLFVDDEIAGETFAVAAPKVGPLEGLDFLLKNTDVLWRPYRTAYVYSTAILPAYQGRGLSKILKAYLLGILKQVGMWHVIGHAREGASLHLCEEFGGTKLVSFDDWYGTGERYWLYHMRMDNR